MRKVVVIGLDGFEPSLVEPLLAAGELPHLARLRQHGGYAHVATTCPAQTPVAWSTFVTGTNPGGHGIFDFVRRDPKTYLPDYSLNRFEQKSAYLPPKAVNLRRGTPIWELLAAAGIPAVILRCPCTFPPDDIRGRMLSGMGVPDLRGGQGTSTLYTSGGGVKARESERIVSVQSDGAGNITTHVIGPRNPKMRSDFLFPISIHVNAGARAITIRSDGQPKMLELREGQWSDWIKVKFKTGLMQSVKGMVRFYLVRVAPVFELYASPVNFDPDAPMFPISAPPEYASELATKLGTFYTTGMVEDHSGLDNGRLSEAAYLRHCEDVLGERERMLQYELQRFDRGLLFCLFDTPDRVQHMLWRFRPNGATTSAADPELARAIEDHYRACDAVVGRALAHADDETLFIVLSDHGMNGFKRGVHLNTWLHDQGLLRLQEGMRPGADAGDLFRHVDWSRTQAYALGLSGIYLNLKGREERGVVDPQAVEPLQSAIIKGLLALRDPKHGDAAIRRVLTRAEAYTGPYAGESPDLMVNFAAGYRVSWGTALGAVPEGQFEDNARKWTADHIIDPTLVPGVLFMNRAFREDRATLTGMAPTILAALGVPKGAAMERESLLV